MTQILSDRIQRIEPSATIAVSTRANELRKQGHDVINLSVGEPDFDTPDFIKEAAIQAIRDGFTKYTAVDGYDLLKTAIVDKLKRDNQLDYTPQQIIASNGAKQSLYNLTQVLLNTGDEVIIPAPYWVSYPAMIQLADAKPVIVETTLEQHFKITPEQLEKAITPKTRLLILNSPSNPTGMAYTLEELRALGDVLMKHPQVVIMTDDIYEYILWNAPFVSLLNACPLLKDRTVVINGISKGYAMTGWRIGYAAGPLDLVNAMKKLQSQNTHHPCSISQTAAVAALKATPDVFDDRTQAFKRRHDQVLSALQAMPGVKCKASDGTFYLFPSIEGAMQTLGLRTDIEFATYLLDKTFVATVPGTAFGSPGHIRLSCATSEEKLSLAMERMASVLAS